MFTTFTGGETGGWQVTRLETVTGEGLPTAPRMSIASGPQIPPQTAASWQLTAFASNVRYVERPEKERLAALQAPLGRPHATCAALIPIRKSQAWWEMTQDERRCVFEARSQHISYSLKYLPAIARQLYHCRDLDQPFDFLTWFEFAPIDANAFEDLVGYLRTTEEWRYVEREVDVRLVAAI